MKTFFPIFSKNNLNVIYIKNDNKYTITFNIVFNIYVNCVQ